MGGGGIIAFLGGGVNLLGGLGGPMPGRAPAALPKSVVWIASLTCLGTGRVGRSAAFWWGQESAGLRGGGNSLGKTVVFPRRDSASLGRSASFPSLTDSLWGGREVLASLWGGPAWEDLVYSPGGGEAWGGALPSLAWEIWFTWLFVCELRLWLFRLVLDLVIFPSFLIVSKLNLVSCLCFTLLNLISPTLSTKSWHSLSLCVEIIATSCDLHSSNCLEVLSKVKLIDLILAWSRSFSAFLSILLALVVFKVDFSLILTGIKSLWRHLKVNILWFLYSEALILSFSHNLNRCRT